MVNDMTEIQPETLISLLGLPDHLRKTLIVAEIRGQVTAEDVAVETKRARAVESSYLNQLTLMGFLHKSKRDRHTLFMSETKLKEEASSLYQRLRDMPTQFRQLICEDMTTALENRIKVFSGLRKN